MNRSPGSSAKLRKIMTLAFKSETPDAEATAAFLTARRIMKSKGIHIEDMLQNFGSSRLESALQRYGHVVVPYGSMRGKTLEQVSVEDPSMLFELKFKSCDDFNEAARELAEAHRADQMGSISDMFSAVFGRG